MRIPIELAPAFAKALEERMVAQVAKAKAAGDMVVDFDLDPLQAQVLEDVKKQAQA